MDAKFSLGRTVMTHGASDRLAPESVQEGLRRHVAGDWGDLEEEDRKANDRALAEGTRLLSAYADIHGIKFWIITEWDRSVTTILLPEEY